MRGRRGEGAMAGRGERSGRGRRGTASHYDARDVVSKIEWDGAVNAVTFSGWEVLCFT